jgi:aryl-alcohol dehydrogenase-like predicted oxidoreductase
MKYRNLGRTGLKVSELGFGCGSIGGLMVRGERKDQLRVVARAVESGINYFDTARIYGDGQSETNLGKVLKELKSDVVVGTKVQLTAADMEHIEEATIESVEGSLKRLGLEYVDLIQLHNFIGVHRQPDMGWVGVDDLRPVVFAFQSLQEQGKVRFWGINGLGETDAIHQAVTTVCPYTIQSCYNLLNPSSGRQVQPNFPFQDYRRLIDVAADNDVGVIAIRILAAGALSGTTERHPVAAQSVSPIATGDRFEEDVEKAQTFGFLIENGYVSSLVEAAVRFAIGKAGISTALIGISNLEQLEQAVAYANKGPLPAEAFDRLNEVWASG